MQPAEGWVRHEIEAASLQERGDGETQRDVRSEFADCPFDDRQELGEMRPAGINTAYQWREIGSHAEQRGEGARGEFAVKVIALPIASPLLAGKQPLSHFGPERNKLVADLFRLEKRFNHERAHQALQHQQSGIGVLSSFLARG